MKIRRGSTRVSILIGGLVFKFPRMFTPEGFKLVTFLGGIHANMTEYFIWLLIGGKKPPLARVYFSCGLCSVQRRIQGTHPNEQDYEIRLNRLGVPPFGSEHVKARLSALRHSFGVANFIQQVDGTLVMVDYGDTLLSPTSLVYFLYSEHIFGVFRALNPSEDDLVAYSESVAAKN